MPTESIQPSTIADQLEEMEFRTLSKFDRGALGVFWSEEGGPSPWEMHPDCDELLQILEGAIGVEILPSSGGPSEHVLVEAGGMVVVPRGCWHRQTMRTRTKELYLTPGRTLHSQADDPRSEKPPSAPHL